MFPKPLGSLQPVVSPLRIEGSQSIPNDPRWHRSASLVCTAGLPKQKQKQANKQTKLDVAIQLSLASPEMVYNSLHPKNHYRLGVQTLLPVKHSRFPSNYGLSSNGQPLFGWCSMLDLGLSICPLDWHNLLVHPISQVKKLRLCGVMLTLLLESATRRWAVAERGPLLLPVGAAGARMGSACNTSKALFPGPSVNQRVVPIFTTGCLHTTTQPSLSGQAPPTPPCPGSGSSLSPALSGSVSSKA